MFVKQAANTLEILEYFARRQTPATLAEIADDLGWPRSSTFNIVSTLAERGFLYEPRVRSGYYPTRRWLALAQEVTNGGPVPEAVHRIAADVAQETGETTVVGAPAGCFAVFVDVIESPHAVRYFARVGERVPIHASSIGRALLAQMTPGERQAIYRKITFEHYSDTTPLDAEAVEQRLKEAEDRGYHQSEAEYVPDLAGVAVSLPAASRHLSIVVVGPVSRCLDRRPWMAEVLRRCVAAAGPIE